MKNPLRKRLPRELKGDFGKYLVIFLFLTLTIGFISGFLVAGDSMIKAYNESFETYQIEYGHFTLKDEASHALLADVEEEEDVTICENYYKDESVDCDLDGETDGTMRLFINRETMNLVCVMDGALPEEADEIAVDRMYADNNDIKTGSRIQVAGKELMVTGLVALSDYSALFSDNSDLMFDSIKFGVSVLSEEGFERFSDKNLFYSYSWRYRDLPADEDEETDLADDFIETLAEETSQAHLEISTVIPRYANQAIQFTGDDMGGDKAMMIVLLYILIVIMAFVFSVSIRHTIAREAAVVGTLMASGYTRRELLVHYMSAPMLVTLIAALIGNILGYTVFKDVVADLYYGSYSLPTFHVVWNSEAFVLTTVVPALIMFATNLFALIRKFSLSPLQFLRRDLTKRKGKRALRLPPLRFMARFRIRIILQNLSGYATLLVGMLFAGILLLFGMMMGPLLTHYQETVTDSMIAKYQYVLETQLDTENEQAEPYCITSLTYDGKRRSEDISVYGIQENSAYFSEELPEEGVLISDGFAEKYEVEVGDTIHLYESYDDGEYDFQVARIIEYPSGLAVFMSQQDFVDQLEPETSLFDVGFTDMELLLHRLATPDDGLYFNGYFSNEELDDLNENYVESCITVDDMTKVSRQLDKSMGSIFGMVKWFAAAMAALLIYLLTKQILERNSTSISMVKILGYHNREIAGLYLTATTIVVLLSSVISLAVASVTMAAIYRIMMMDYGGWLTLYYDPKTYPLMFLMLVGAYAIVAVAQYRKIRKIPMDEALKNVE